MERRTMADIRREKFNKQGVIARELASLALQDIDDALQDNVIDLNANVVELHPDIPDDAA